MRRQDFSYDLPPELIAQFPASPRTSSRLFGFQRFSEQYQHGHFAQLADWLRPTDLLVLNNTRVIPARLYGTKASGGRIEVLLERVVSTHQILAKIRASKSPPSGSRLLLTGTHGITVVEVLGREQEFFRLAFPQDRPVLAVLEDSGHIPLPPYIARPDQLTDQQDYQTVYATQPGAVAAPTAGLHFDEDLLQRLQTKGIQAVFVTLHVGAGTFQPMRVDNILEHQIHAESMALDAATCDAILTTKAKGGRVIAVGTTTARCLESAAREGGLKPFQGETRLFIYPGYEFKVIDGLITNFHLPESSLLMLVAAFAGHAHTLQAYRTAIQHRYRFYSYGDAMLIT